MLTKEDFEMLCKEKSIQHEINKNIDDKISFVFKAGAGSGKTYALVESIKYLIKKHGAVLKRNHQKIVVVTYTNVATKEIKERLGNSDIVLVSTIHERIWDIISIYNKELVEIHKKKIEEELEKINEMIQNEERFSELDKKFQEEFIEIINNQVNKESYYEYYNERATPFKNEMKKLFSSIPLHETKLLRSVERFKKLVNNLYKRQSYTDTIIKIDNKEEGYLKLIYNSKKQRDRLERMEFSHDTLLEYGKIIIKKHDLLQRIIIDKYPYFFIDEYQDTFPAVIEIMHTLNNYSIQGNHLFFVGYFGDEMQNIYSEGIGKQLETLHPNLKTIHKNINRRSANEIINVINKFRDSESQQQSIYKDAGGGNVEFYVGERKDIGNFITNYQGRLDGPINCLVLTNSSISEYIKIDKLYNVMKTSPLYSEGFGFEQLNTELLSKDKEKLGDVQKSLYNLFHLIVLFENKENTVRELLSKDDIKNGILLKELNELIHNIESIREEETLGELLSKIDDVATREGENYTEIKNKRFNLLFNKLLLSENRGIFSSRKYKEFLIKTLGKINDAENLTDIEYDKKIKKIQQVIDELLSIEKEEFLNWYHFLNDSTEQSIEYHTYHGTKGLEYDNVLIIMENKFGNRPYFDYYFKNRKHKENLEECGLKIYEAAENLLYVATSRAIKNLVIFYVDEIDEFQEEITELFGKPLAYPVESK